MKSNDLLNKHGHTLVLQQYFSLQSLIGLQQSYNNIDCVGCVSSVSSNKNTPLTFNDQSHPFLLYVAHHSKNVFSIFFAHHFLLHLIHFYDQSLKLFFMPNILLFVFLIDDDVKVNWAAKCQPERFCLYKSELILTTSSMYLYFHLVDSF